MDEPLLPPKHTRSQQRQHPQLPPEFLMPVPFCELVCDKLYYICTKCLCCFNYEPI